MSRKVLLAVVVLAVLAVLVAAAGREVLDVQVLNFPDPQRVRGVVTIEGTIRHADLVRLPDIIVPPVKPTETTRLVSAGTVVTDGFTHAVLSLNGITKGDALKGGVVGAYFLPEEESVARSFIEAGQVQFPLEVIAQTAPLGAYFASKPERQVLGFPSYRVLLYNTTDKTVTVNLFAYLTN